MIRGSSLALRGKWTETSSVAAFLPQAPPLVCQGCGEELTALPPRTLCPFKSHPEYFRAVGARTGPGLRGAGPGGRGNDVVIKVQVGGG